jgi:hypothetical protein
MVEESGSDIGDPRLLWVAGVVLEGVDYYSELTSDEVKCLQVEYRRGKPVVTKGRRTRRGKPVVPKGRRTRR